MWQLKKKGAASERVRGPAARSTKHSVSLIGSLHQSFGGTIFLGSVCAAVSAIITRQLISWYSHGSQNNNFFWWSNATQLTGDGIRDEVDWGNLPLELCGEIGKRMVSQLDIAYFRCVCKGWRLALPSPIRFPLWLPSLPCCDPKCRDVPYTISEVTIYGDIRKWGAYPYMQVNQDGIFPLTEFLATSPLVDEVSFYERSLMKREITLSQLTFFAKAYLGPHRRRHERLFYVGFPDKLVMISSSNAHGVNPSYSRPSDLSVVGYFGWYHGKMKGRLSLLRLGGPPKNWVWDTDFCTKVFIDIATYKGQLCTLDRCGRVFMMDYNTLKMTQVCEPLFMPSPSERWDRKSLFEACGDLYLFDFKRFDTTKYVVAYKLSFRLQKWLKVEDHISQLFQIVALFFLCDDKKLL